MSDDNNDDNTDMLLTTVDNVWDPFTQWDEWVVEDARLGHHTLSLLARVAVVGDEQSEADQELATDHAMLEIARENVSGLHKLVFRSSLKNSEV